MNKLSLICLLMIGLVISTNFIYSAITPTRFQLKAYEPMFINMIPQNAELSYSNIDLTYSTNAVGTHFGFKVFYMRGAQKITLVDYANNQLTQTIHANRTAELVIVKIKTDQPLEIKGEELNSIFN